jgi:hypothetical protein
MPRCCTPWSLTCGSSKSVAVLTCMLLHSLASFLWYRNRCVWACMCCVAGALLFPHPGPSPAVVPAHSPSCIPGSAQDRAQLVGFSGCSSEGRPGPGADLCTLLHLQHLSAGGSGLMRGQDTTVCSGAGEVPCGPPLLRLLHIQLTVQSETKSCATPRQTVPAPSCSGDGPCPAACPRVHLGLVKPVPSWPSPAPYWQQLPGLPLTQLVCMGQGQVMRHTQPPLQPRSSRTSDPLQPSVSSSSSNSSRRRLQQVGSRRGVLLVGTWARARGRRGCTVAPCS